MAVAPMLKATVLGHAQALDPVIDTVQRAGALEIEATEYEHESVERVQLFSDDARVVRLDEQIADAQFVRDFLGRFRSAQHAFSTFITEKIHLDRDDYLGLEFDVASRKTYRECVSLADRIASNEREIERLVALVADLMPWRDFRMQIARWEGTDHTVLLTGTVPAALGPGVRQQLREEVVDVTVEELGPVDDRQAWVVVAHRDSVADVRAVLAATEFCEVGFPGLSDYPAEEIADARERIETLGTQIEEARERATEIALAEYARWAALTQALESERDALLVRREFNRTERAFVIHGWIPVSDREKLETALAGFGGSLDLTLEEPTADDEPPVLLSNSRLIQPFEILTDLYGRPRYRDADPTPILAPFFLLFFAICIGDFGYGLLLLIGAWLIKTRLDVAPGVKRFMDLLMLGGAGSMVIGVLLGGYFAIPVEALPGFLRAVQVLDPIAGIQTFLLAALAIGVVQVFFGVFVAAWHSIKRGDTASAIADHISIVFLFAMLAVTGAAGASGNGDLVRASLVIGIVGTMLLQGRAVQAALGRAEAPGWDRALGAAWALAFVGGLGFYAIAGLMTALWVALGACLLAVVSRSARAGVIGLLAGAYGVYGLTAVVGDILSYLRLAALGLSSTLVGWVFNILTGLVWGAASPLFSRGLGGLVGGVIIAALAVAVFAVGHVFNVVINLLGAFVHPARLQFVEFFSKFYEAGGRPYSPFAVRAENLVLGASRADGEGGRS